MSWPVTWTVVVTGRPATGLAVAGLAVAGVIDVEDDCRPAVTAADEDAVLAVKPVSSG